MDATDVAAWVGAVSGLGSLVVAGLNHQHQQREPVLAAQRALRDDVLRDVDVVLNRIAEAKAAARGRDLLNLGHSASKPLTDWSAQESRFTTDEVVRAVRKEGVALSKWDRAVSDYGRARQEVQRLEALKSDFPKLASSDADFAQMERKAREDVVIYAPALTSASEIAEEAVERIRSLLHEIAKRSGT